MEDQNRPSVDAPGSPLPVNDPLPSTSNDTFVAVEEAVEAEAVEEAVEEAIETDEDQNDEDQRVFVCPYCEDYFLYQGDLQDHIAERHQDQRYCCQFCPETFRSIRRYYKHNDTRH